MYPNTNKIILLTTVASLLILLITTTLLYAHEGHNHDHHDHHHHTHSSVVGTNKMKSPFPINLILTDECLDEFLFKRNFFHKECLKKTISKGLGYGIVVGSGILKLPMVLNVLKQQSGLGLSISSLLMETSALTAGACASILKHLPFSIWGESLIIAVQNIVLIWLTEEFAKENIQRRFGMIGGIVSMFIIVNLIGSPSWSNWLVGYATLLGSVSRMQQIIANFQCGHTGVLSIITQGLLMLGVIARLGTILVETSDFATIASTALALVLNAILLGQVIMYWDASKAALAAAAEEKKKKHE
jgi:mannose-P-dolichol utilization defect protein 1